MSQLISLLNEFHEIVQLEKSLKLRKQINKAQLDALYELGDVGKQVSDPSVPIVASRSRTTTYQHSQSAREDIEKIKMMDIELGHATKKETWSWTVREVKKKDDK